MSIVHKDYIVCEYNVVPPIPEGGDLHPEIPWIWEPWNTEPYVFPVWFSNASQEHRKIVKVLGASAAVTPKLADGADPGSNEFAEGMSTPLGIRLMSNLTEYFPLQKFVMMLNNYNSVKQFDITNHNIDSLTWYCMDAYKHAYPYKGEKLDLVIELELIVVNENDTS
jgi:hypothetical protein